jgi:bifunctional non-homologous end joining protein LigD
VHLPSFFPLRLGRKPQPFNDPDWLYELKWDGFRSLAYIQSGQAHLVSRNGNVFKKWPLLNLSLAYIGVRDAVVDGEIVCLDKEGKADFKALMVSRGEPCFYAFDLLWLNGMDLRMKSLVQRKHVLREVIRGDSRLRYVEHFCGQDGEAFFRVCCQHDLEDVVAKRRDSTYLEADHESAWVKIKNRDYTGTVDRGELMNPGKKKSSGKVLDSAIQVWGVLKINARLSNSSSFDLWHVSSCDAHRQIQSARTTIITGVRSAPSMRDLSSQAEGISEP